MAAPMAIVSDVASVSQLVDLGVKVLVGVSGAIREGVDPPDVVKYRQKRIPSLVERLLLIQAAAHPGDTNLRDDIVQNCLTKVEALKNELDTVQVRESDTTFNRGKKALVSVWKQAAFDKALNGIEQDLTTLLSYLEISSRSIHRYRESADTVTISTVQEERQEEIKVNYEAELKQLRHVPEASFHSQTFDRCMKDTRVSILQELYAWANAMDTQHIYWLNGMAGTGKSAIALSFSHWLEENNLLGGTCFCSIQRSAELRDVRRILPTLIWGLAHVSWRFAAALIETVPASTLADLYSFALPKQFETFMQQPIWSALEQDNRTLVWLVDALDECDDCDATEQFLGLLLKFAPSRRIKIIVTSRPEPHLAQAFFLSNPSMHRVLRLHEVKDDVVETDIRLYLDTRLKELRRVRKNLQNLESEWPSPTEVSVLIRLARNLFIYAFTAYRYIAGRAGQKGDPVQRLTRLATSYLPVGAPMNASLDDLYGKILQAAFQEVEIEEARDIADTLGAIVCVCDALSAKDLGTLLGIGPRRVAVALVSLHSLILVPDTDSRSCVSTLHASFKEYLKDQKRCGTEEWFVLEEEVHCTLSRSCLDILLQELRFNISCAVSSHLANVDDMNTVAADDLAPYLTYASRFWADHVAASRSAEELLGRVQPFLLEKFLFWLEVLSIAGRIDEASSTLMKASKCYSDVLSLFTFLKDAYAFTVAFRTPMAFSAPHIYLSALPFAPSDSLVATTFREQFPGTLIVENAFAGEKTYPILQIEHRKAVSSVAFSWPDGKRIVSGHDDGTVRVWSAENGKELWEPKEWHTDHVNSVAIAPNGRWIASGSSDYTVGIWDADTGMQLLKPLKGHEAPVASVTFSPSGKRIASSSVDCTIRLWALLSGKEVSKPLQGHNACVTSVVFSPNGKRLASSSDDHTVRIWGAESEEASFEVIRIIKGHTAVVNALAFSPDGQLIASASLDCTIRVWDAETGEPAGKVMEGHSISVSSVAFSPDGKCIASGSTDSTIRLWDALTGTALSTPIDGHAGPVTAVAFSPDSKQIVSSSLDCTIRTWKTQAVGEEPTAQELHSTWVTSVSFSPDGKRIASGSRDCTIRLWDAETGKLLLQPMTGHKTMVKAMAFSRDGRWVVSSSKDGTVRLWDSSTGHATLNLVERLGEEINAVAFSPDGTHILSSSGGIVRVWNVETGKEVSNCSAVESLADTAAFSLDGKQVISGFVEEDYAIELWNVETGESLSQVMARDKKAVRSFALSPDGKRFVVGTYKGLIRIWNVETGQETLKPMEGHVAPVNSVAFSRDGTKIVSGSNDRTVRVWDAMTGEAMSKPMQGHAGSVSLVEFSPDSKNVVSASLDGTIRVWALDSPTTSVLKELTGLMEHSEQNADQVLELVLGDEFGSLLSNIIGRDLEGTLSQNSVPRFDELDPDYVYMADGWIFLLGGRLFWVPPHLRSGLWWSRTAAIIGPDPVKIDMSSFVHGDAWTDCKSQELALVSAAL